MKGLGMILLAVLISISFSTWPLLASHADKKNAAWSVLIVSLCSILPAATIGGLICREFSEAINTRSLLILAGAGIVNGFGFYIYNRSVANPEVQTGLMVTTVSIAMTIVGPIMAWLIKSETMSPRQWLGVALGVAAALLVASPKKGP